MDDETLVKDTKDKSSILSKKENKKRDSWVPYPKFYREENIIQLKTRNKNVNKDFQTLSVIKQHLIISLINNEQVEIIVRMHVAIANWCLK